MSWRALLLAVLVLCGGAGALFIAFPAFTVGVASGLFCSLGNESRERKAEAGDVDAQAMAAGYAYFGECGAEDPVKGRDFAERSGAQGHRDGLFWLGMYRAVGRGGPQDVAGAIDAYRALAEAGDIRGAAELGDLFAHGVRGEAADRVEAYFYLRLAEFLKMDSEANTRHARKDAWDMARRLTPSLSAEERRVVEARLDTWRASAESAGDSKSAPARR